MSDPGAMASAKVGSDSFVAQGDDGIEPSGLRGREEPEEDADRDGDTDCQRD